MEGMDTDAVLGMALGMAVDTIQGMAVDSIGQDTIHQATAAAATIAATMAATMVDIGISIRGHGSNDRE